MKASILVMILTGTVAASGCVVADEVTETETETGQTQQATSLFPWPTFNSCEGRCGQTAFSLFGTGGCSCADGCEFFGTCCRDVATYCNRPGYDFTVGRSKVNIVSAKGAAIGGKGTKGEYRYDTEFVTTNDPAVIGLSKVMFADIDTDQEVSRCAAACSGDLCTIEAFTSFDDNKADCAGLGLRFPGWANVQGATVTTTYSGYSCLGGSTADSIPFLSSVWIEEIDSVGEIGGCQIDYVGGTCGWRLHSVQSDDVYTQCKASLLRLQSGMAYLGTFSSVVNTWASGGNPVPVAYKPHRRRSRRDVPMTSENETVCFLTKTTMEDLDDGSEKGGCEIISNDGLWTLRAEVTGWEGGDLDADAYCSAACASVPSTGAFPGRATALVDALGARARLFQSGDYDRPVVIFEGFDTLDRLGPLYYMDLAGPLIINMAGLGFDIWVVDNEDAGQDARQTAAENMKAIDVAYRYAGWNIANPGKKVPAIGLSMGAFTGRFGLATWEAGTYRIPGAEFVPGLASLPPVSSFVALVGSQEGANFPLAVQTVVQDFGDYQELGESFEALNSPLAVNMLNARVDPGCDQVVSQWCNSTLGIGNLFGAHGDQTLKNVKDIRVYGNTVNYDSVWRTCPLNTDGCVKRAGVAGGACVTSATPKAAFYNDVNHRGPRGNGYPDSVATIGIATGSWLQQGDDNFAKAHYCQDAECMYQTPFTAGATEMGRVRLDDNGHGILNWCDRDTTVRAFVTGDDVRPGDLSERKISDLAVDVGGEANIFMDQWFPMMHVPTYSALGCGEQINCSGETCMAACEANNAAARRFTRIHAQPKNEYHGHVDAVQGATLLAYMWDGSTTGDGDGYFAAPSTGTVTIRASGSPESGVYPLMQLYLDRQLVQSWTVTGTPTDYTFTPPAGSWPGPGAVAVGFANDACCVAGQDRNLFIDYVVASGKLIQGDAANVVIDRGTYFDGIDVVPSNIGGWNAWTGVTIFPMNPFTQAFSGPFDCDEARADVNPGAREVCDGVDNDCDGFVDEACLSRYPLAVTKAGPGLVTSNVYSVHCGDACAATFDAGTAVTLTATADPGYTFTGWSGACAGTGSCVVSMTAARSVTARFEVSAVPAALRVWFKFDEASGVPVNSGTLGSVGQTYSAVAQGVAGRNGSAIQLNATYPGVTIPDQASIDGYTSLTMEGWMSFTTLPVSTAPYATLGKKNGSYICRMYISGSYGLSNIIWNPGILGNSMTIPTPSVGTWNHFACTWDGATKQLRTYWNGVQQGTTTISTGNPNLVDGLNPLTIGFGSSGESFTGKLDDFKLWNVTRTPADVCASAGKTWNGSACL